MSNTRPCSKCHGEGRVHSQFGLEHGFEGPEGKKCVGCHGTGTFEEPDYRAIIDALFTTRGKVRRFRKSFPQKLDHFGTVFGARAYYVWRWARFSGGADVTQPMTAELVNYGEPYKEELSKIADLVARKVFGTDLAAVCRWGTALGFLQPEQVPEGMPDSAYSGGPVVTHGEKPWWELAELV